jgi:hypothetical protein
MLLVVNDDKEKEEDAGDDDCDCLGGVVERHFAHGKLGMIF